MGLKNITEPLPSKDWGIHITKHRTDRRNLKYAVEMGSGVMIHIPSFIKTGSVLQKFIGGWGYTTS
jgi:hypothetical protein